jgi:hypothetical protein
MNYQKVPQNFGWDVVFSKKDTPTQRVLNDLEYQTFFPSYDLAPPTPSPPVSRQQIVSLSQASCLSPVELPDRRKGGGAKSYDG